MDEKKVIMKAFNPPIGAKRLGGVNHQDIAKSAPERLRKLAFDPLTELVSQYEYLCKEIQRMDYIRDNQHDTDLVPEYVSKKYSPRLHIETYDRVANIAKELLRYGYARVSESNELITNAPPMMQIQLTKKGDVFEIGVPNGASDTPPNSAMEPDDDKW